MTDQTNVIERGRNLVPQILSSFFPSFQLTMEKQKAGQDGMEQSITSSKS